MLEGMAELSPRMRAAVDEMTALILSHYPSAAFRLSRDDEDSTIAYLTTVVDVDDPDEVADLVIDRMHELLVNEDLPLVVVQIRTSERVAAALAERRAAAARA